MAIRGAETGADTATRQADKRNKQFIFKNCVPFNDCICKTNNTQVDNAKDMDVVMQMYNLKEFNNNYLKIENLWHCCRDGSNATITESESLKINAQITETTPGTGNAKDGEIAVS